RVGLRLRSHGKRRPTAVGQHAPNHIGRLILHYAGTLRRSSSSQAVASASLGARQSPRGESDPPEPTFGPFGRADRLNWLSLKKRSRKTSSHVLIVARS